MSDCCGVTKDTDNPLRLVTIQVSQNTSQSPHFSFPLVCILAQEVKRVQTLSLCVLWRCWNVLCKCSQFTSFVSYKCKHAMQAHSRKSNTGIKTFKMSPYDPVTLLDSCLSPQSLLSINQAAHPWLGHTNQLLITIIVMITEANKV